MIRLQLTRWQTWIAYGAFVIFSLVLGFYLTFPYEALRQRILDETSKLSLHVRIRSMGPGFFGITAKGIEVSRKMEAKEDKAPESIAIPSMMLRPTLFPPGFSVRAKVFGGTLSGEIGSFSLPRMLGTPGPGKRDSVGTLSIAMNAENVNLSDESIKRVFGVDLAGSVRSQLNLSAPVIPIGRAHDRD